LRSYPFRLQTDADVLGLLEVQVEVVRAVAEVGTLEKARTVGDLAGIALKALVSGNLAARIEMLETVLKKWLAFVPGPCAGSRDRKGPGCP
jgi:hypothetical protein